MMKRLTKMKRTLGLLTFLAIPTVLFAVTVYDSDLTAWSWGEFGTNDTNNGDSWVAVGNGNTRGANSQSTLAVGDSLTAYDDNSLVVGTWNSDTQKNETFIVGIGQGAGQEKNAFEVFTDGKIRIPNGQNAIPLDGYGVE